MAESYTRIVPDQDRGRVAGQLERWAAKASTLEAAKLLKSEANRVRTSGMVGDPLLTAETSMADAMRGLSGDERASAALALAAFSRDFADLLPNPEKARAVAESTERLYGAIETALSYGGEPNRISSPAQARQFLLDQHKEWREKMGVTDIRILQERVVDGHRLWSIAYEGLFMPISVRYEVWIRDDCAEYSINGCAEHTIEQVVRGEVAGPHHSPEDHPRPSADG